MPRLRHERSDAEQRHGAAGQRGRFDLRRPVLQRDGDAGRHGHGGFRQERLQLYGHLQDHVGHDPATDVLTIGPGITIRGSSGTIRMTTAGATRHQPGDDRGRRQRRTGRRFVYDQGFSGGYTCEHRRRDRHQRGEQPGAAGGLADLPLPATISATPWRPDGGGELHGGPGLRRSEYIDGGRAAAVQREHQRHAGADQFRHLCRGGGQGQGDAGDVYGHGRQPTARSPWPSATVPAATRWSTASRCFPAGQPVQADQLRRVGRRHDHRQPHHLQQPGDAGRPATARR